MNRKLFPIEREIYHTLNEQANSLYEKDASQAQRTKAFKEALFHLGEVKHNFQVWGLKEKDRLKGEWLWDICWIRCGKDWKDFRGVYLACEIEWVSGYEILLEDFLKLTVANADFRLFICTVPATKTKYEAVFDRLMAACPGSRGARYLVIGAPKNRPEEGLPYRAWTL